MDNKKKAHTENDEINIDEELEEIKSILDRDITHKKASVDLGNVRAAGNGGTLGADEAEESKGRGGSFAAAEGEGFRPHGFVAEMFNWIREIVLCVIFVVLVFVFVVRVVGVQGPSMTPTLLGGDRVLLLSNVLYTPRSGDIVVLTQKSYSDQPIVKRIIALEGQTVYIDFDSHEVWVDGVLLDEPYINEPTAYPGNISFPATVPEGCIFVMGDNRNLSLDSRMSEIGMVDTRSVLGKVLFVIFPLSRIGAVT